MRKILLSMMLGFSFGVLSDCCAQGEVTPNLFVHQSAKQIDDEVYLGVHFQMAPNWHIYWKYPGDAGLPTRVQWNTPNEVLAGELLWPAPKRFIQNETMTGYGYDNEVVLLTKMVIPKAVKEGTVTADIKWLGCSQSLCVPGKKTLSLPLADIISPPTKVAKDLSEWRAQVPMNNPEELFSEQIEIGGKPPILHVAEALTWKIAPLNVEWYPDLGQYLKTNNVSLVTKDTTSTLSFDLEFLPGASVALTHLDSVIVYERENGKRRSISLPLNLTKKELR